MKKLIATLGLMGIMMMNSVAAKPGIFMADSQTSGDQQPQTCSTKQTGSKMNTDWGIFVTGFAGIFVTGFFGIIVIDGFRSSDAKSKCRG